MDRAASIASQRHAGCATVTVSVNHVAFNHSIPVGSIVTVEANISRAFSTSMEVYIDVWMENMQGERTKANEAIYTFVAVDEQNRPSNRTRKNTIQRSATTPATKPRTRW